MRPNPIERAIALIREGEGEAARASLVAHLEQTPGDAKGWALLARVAKNPEEKESLLGRVASLPEDGSGVHTWAREKLEALRRGRVGQLDGNATHRIDVVEPSEPDDGSEGETHPPERPIEP